ncbi:MAG: M24 family metallopeptidase [Anaerolineae bacterium]|nr:M24 family metallopeptidase [Anaerolineae bacterium]MDW8172328.1 M24 family metallopeptidase [Anaerolineae bacterium]
MRADLDTLMAERKLDAILVGGGEQYNDVRDYLSYGARITGGLIVKRRDHAPLLTVSGMELDEARKSGLECTTYAEMGFYDLLQETDDRLLVEARLWGRALARAGLERGRVGLYGTDAIHVILALYQRLCAELPQYDFVGDDHKISLFQAAFLTKDAEEMARVRSVAQRTDEVLRATWDFIAKHRAADDERVVDDQGQALTVGQVKSFVRAALLARGLEDTGMIFAQGRDAGFPHSRGQDDQALKVGQAIVFDLFPRELGGGYHHDMTRTWCINFAPPAVQQAYDQVMQAFNRALEAYALGKPTHLLQEVVLDTFEAQGHPTLRSDPKTMCGYVHSLGHGLGLNVHERPSITHLRKDDVFQVGNLITIEPGLYYPEDGYGVRVEDTFFIDESGALLSLTPFPKDLILPLKG